MKSFVRIKLLIVSFFVFPLYSSDSVITDFEVKDLQLLKTLGQEIGVLGVVNHTATMIGLDHLKLQLANPLSNLEKLKKRQNIIKLLVEDSELLANIKDALGEYAKYEQSLITIKANPAISKKAIQKFYFKNKYFTWLNKYPLGLEVGQIAHAFNLSAPVVEHFVLHVLVNDKLKKYLHISCGHDHGHSHKKHKHDHQAPSNTALLAYYTYNCIHWGIHVAGAKGLWDEFKNQAEIIQEMQKQLIEVYNCLKSARAIASLVSQHPQLSQLIPQAQELDALFDPANTQISDELKELMGLLQSSTFAGDSSLFSRIGRTLRAYQLVATVEQELFAKLSAVAEIDFSASCAQLYLQFQDTPTPFCWAEFVKADTPQLQVHQFWNPLFKNVVPGAHIIRAGQGNPRIGIVTGPNKGGKSTALFSIAQTVVLGQSLTLCPAAYCAFTPFEKIRTGFCIHQRIEQGESLFSATLKLANDVLQDAQSRAQGFSFIVMDELFNSTDATRGAKLASSFIKSLANSNRYIGLVSTHFLDIACLEDEMPEKIRNYKVGKNAQNSYLFERGIASKDDVFALIDADTLNLNAN